MLSHANLTAAARQLGTGLALTPRDRFLALAPLAHVMGFVVSLCAPLAAGATVIMLPRFELAALLDTIQRHRVTVIAAPPPVLAALARDPAVSRYDVSAVEAVVSGGAPVSPELQAEAAGRFPGAMIGQGYGLTETSAVIPVPDRAGMLPGSVGRLAPGTELRLLDPDTGRDARPGEPGELCVRGPQVMAGYLGRPEATAQMLGAGGWLRTGDLGRVDPGGRLFIVDRLKELIKVNAIQVAPAELEAVLAGDRRWPTPPWSRGPTSGPARRWWRSWSPAARSSPASSSPGSRPASPRTSASVRSAWSARSPVRPQARSCAACWSRPTALSSRAPGPDSRASPACRPVSSSKIAPIGPSTSSPSPADQEQSVAARRNPFSLRSARQGNRLGRDPVAAAAAATTGIGRDRPSGMAMSCPCTSTSMSGSRWLTPGALRREPAIARSRGAY